MNATPILTDLQFAEAEGSRIAEVMVNAVVYASDQAEIVRVILAALNEAFNTDNNAVLAAVAAGFSGCIADAIEQGADFIGRSEVGSCQSR